MVKLSDYIVNCVADFGVKHVFLLTGGGAMHLNDSLGRCERLSYVCNLHEQAAAIAAEAYGKMTGRLGVAMVTTGPGATNAVTGVAGAWLDSTPCLFISGQVKRADLKRDSGVRQLGVQEIDIVTIVSSITKYAVTITEPDRARYHIERALYLATHGRPGPVWLDIPLDVQASMIDPEQMEGFKPETSSSPDPERLKREVAQTIALLNEAERPFLFVGYGARAANAQVELEQALDALHIPFGTTWQAMDLIPDSHPLLVGRPGPIAPRGANFALQNSDFLLSVGARLDLVATAFAPARFARAAKKVMVDIDPNELAKMQTPIALPICADARDFLSELLRQRESILPRVRSAWLNRCAEWRLKFPLVLSQHRDAREKVSMFYFTEVLCEELAEGDLIVPTSSGNAIETLLLAFKTKARQRIFVTTGLGAMGFGLPASIGACLANEGKPTVCVDADGGFQLNIQELETLRRLNLPIKIFVINNNGYGSIVASQRAYFSRLVGAEPSSGLTLPDVTKIAAAYGLRVRRIDNQQDLRADIRSVLDEEGPVVCEVMAIPEEPRAPRVSSVQKPDGTMVSKPLEDMWPFLDREEFLANMIIPPVEE